MSEYLSSSFFPQVRLNCPSCLAEINRAATFCPTCSFSLSVACTNFPFPAPPASPLIDPGQLIKPAEATKIAIALAKLKKRIPDASLVICLIDLPQNVRIKEFAFWLHNIVAGGEDTPQQFNLLLCDANNSQLALSLDYQTENYLNSQDIERSLSDLSQTTFDKSLQIGLTEFITSYQKLLEVAWKEIQQALKSQ